MTATGAKKKPAREKDPWLVRHWPYRLYRAPEIYRSELGVEYISHPAVRWFRRSDLFINRNEWNHTLFRLKMDHRPFFYIYAFSIPLFFWGISLPWGLYLQTYLKFEYPALLNQYRWLNGLPVLLPISIGVLAILYSLTCFYIADITNIVRQKYRELRPKPAVTEFSGHKLACYPKTKIQMLHDIHESLQYQSVTYPAELSLRDLMILKISLANIHTRTLILSHRLIFLHFLWLLILQGYSMVFMGILLQEFNFSFTELVKYQGLYVIYYSFFGVLAASIIRAYKIVKLPKALIKDLLTHAVKNNEKRRRIQRDRVSAYSFQLFVLLFHVGAVIGSLVGMKLLLDEYLYPDVVQHFFSISNYHLIPSALVVSVILSMLPLRYFLRKMCRNQHIYFRQVVKKANEMKVGTFQISERQMGGFNFGLDMDENEENTP